MAKTGRKPKPSSLRLVEGKRGHRPIPKEVQPHPVKGGVSSPVFLSASGKKEWRRVVKGLQSHAPQAISAAEAPKMLLRVARAGRFGEFLASPDHHKLAPQHESYGHPKPFVRVVSALS